MSQANQVREIVERVATRLLSARLEGLCEEITRQVAAEVEALPAAAPAPVSAAARLNAAVNALYGVTSQAEILRTLLDHSVEFAGRCVLFVVRAGTAKAWESRGLDSARVRDLCLDMSNAVVERVQRERAALEIAAQDFDPAFSSAVNASAETCAMVVPLMVRDKVAALVYADDGGRGAALDSAALELLVRSAGTWIEMVSLRKAAGLSSSGAEHESSSERPPEAHAAHAEPVAVANSENGDRWAAEPAAPRNGAGQHETSADKAEDEQHRRAHRFAKLLVEEIELYNKSKVAEGRKRKDLYALLKDDIEKSRAAYEQRFGQTVGGDYFSAELVRILADNDPALLGSNFSR